MNPLDPTLTRRDFLRKASCAAVGTSALFSSIWDLRRVNAAALTGADYGALVCIFLRGGNDCNNTVIPYEQTAYDNYAANRGVLALPRAELLPIQPLNAGSPPYALHPRMAEIKQLFDGGQCAILTNVGTLVVPTTRDDFRARRVPLPKQLYSHNDQQVQWETGIAAGPTETGWGGRVADIINTLNTNGQVSMSISIAGVNTFEVGREVFQYHVTTSGPVALSRFPNPIRQAQTNAIENLLNAPQDNLYEVGYKDVFKRALGSAALIQAATENITFTTVFPENLTSDPTRRNNLARQLRMVARLIAARDTLNMRRQVFFCAVGGYDTHDEQLAPHANLLEELSQGIKAFYDCTVELGVADKVTLFTASDFGRGLPANGDGTDHAWGGHQLVVGGGVRGGHFYGQYPALEINGPDDASRGSWIPTTSVDEYSATLARWFGVSDSDLDLVFPNLPNFPSRDLGFMA